MTKEELNLARSFLGFTYEELGLLTGYNPTYLRHAELGIVKVSDNIEKAIKKQLTTSIAEERLAKIVEMMREARGLDL